MVAGDAKAHKVSRKFALLTGLSVIAAVRISTFVLPLPSLSRAGSVITGTTAESGRRSQATALAAAVEPYPPMNPKTEPVMYDMPWAECIVEHSRRGSSDEIVETWVFRLEHFEEFEQLLRVRNSNTPTGSPDKRWKQQPVAADVQCHERAEDVELVCAECVLLMVGGPYTGKGFVAPAYPPQTDVHGCLSSTKALPPKEESYLSELTAPQQIAFCNNINARFAGA
mmetsp:Transcript_73726/g.130161  ORF Transcript_73726/g.130161 Transcript_73726/m.130161 type:complete len:226 (-) Transcript_73726:40-717(-)|eukprot:CAMPEP_0197648866 /NCGR_PEP_ID=MMETSP1338-20131121/28007_1 /TAXON_ID=43686 ORGANISM="Pelagodinium beii, Strain RCC1491" /NCGR_SAMPLE_ID=MMETSP1338 /ASSEMBLY_ACC=CAM_ASM_000754 /LENGTH=225 /DNA_ID=CAMNT_0043222933 /DNA_START=54 /DNA_END=731 /DNA_ORIENTATION=-